MFKPNIWFLHRLIPNNLTFSNYALGNYVSHIIVKKLYIYICAERENTHIASGFWLNGQGSNPGRGKILSK
jgi:hypothetical protein